MLGTDSGLFVYDAATLKLRHSYPWTADVNQLALSDDGRYAALLSGVDDGSSTPDTWWLDTDTGEPAAILQLPPADCANGVTFSPDGRWLGIACSSVKLWDGNPAMQLTRVEMHPNQVKSLAFSPDGRWLALGGYWGRIWLWDRVTHRLHASLNGQSDNVLGLLFSPDSTTLLSLDQGGDLWLWDVASQSVRTTVYLHNASAVTYSPDGHTLVTWGEHLELRDPATGVMVNTLDLSSWYVYDIAFSPDGGTLAALEHGLVEFWDLASGAFLCLSARSQRAYLTGRL